MMEVLAGARPLSGRARQVARSREELLGLLADFSGGGGGGGEGECDRELSFSDFVVVDTAKPSPRRDDADGERVRGAATAPPPSVENGQGRSLPSSSSSEQLEETASKQQQQQAVVAARERRLRRRRRDSRGSCGGSGDGVLLNFYVPRLLTRSMTTPRPARGALPAAAALATAASGKSRTGATLAVGCWPALWGGGGGHKPAKPAARRRDTRVAV